MFAHFPYLMHAKSEFIFMKYFGETFYSLYFEFDSYFMHKMLNMNHSTMYHRSGQFNAVQKQLQQSLNGLQERTFVIEFCMHILCIQNNVYKSSRYK